MKFSINVVFSLASIFIYKTVACYKNCFLYSSYTSDIINTISCLDEKSYLTSKYLKLCYDFLQIFHCSNIHSCHRKHICQSDNIKLNHCLIKLKLPINAVNYIILFLLHIKVSCLKLIKIFFWIPYIVAFPLKWSFWPFYHGNQL